MERKQFFVRFFPDRSGAFTNIILHHSIASIVYQSDADNTMVKICDFGFAKRVHMPQSLTTLCGSLFYVAPELLKNHPYDESADMWSVGVIIFFLLAGYLVSCN